MSTQDENKGLDNQGSVLCEQNGAVAIITLSRPAALNALTWTMYTQLEAHLNRLASDDGTRAIIIRGEGPRAFAAGTDIRQFQGFSGADGITYEQQMDTVIERLATMPQPVLAALHGYAVGAGLVIATACDLRYATSDARLGAPMARTLGNCLSLKNYQRLANALGIMRTKELLFTSRLLSAEEALRCGFLTGIVDDGQLDGYVLEVAQRISTLAPLTIRATKEAFKRLADGMGEDAHAFDDILAQVYGSHDFAEGVQAHSEKRRPSWTGN
jgi:enoyl-CoA hydratase/carnithine racemase